jgi:predicted dehydrogenase
MPIDLALLGCAHPHVPDVLGVLAAEPDLRLVAAWDADRSAIPGPISNLAVGRAESAIRTADAVLICAPTDQRPTLCAQAARAGRPLLVEKPIARTAAEARQLAREVQRSRTPAMVALHLRQVPAIARLATVMWEGLLGRLSSVRASQAHPGALDGWFDGPVAWYRDRERAGVGGFGDLGFNLVDLLGALPGDEPPRLATVAVDRDDVGGTALGTWNGVPLAIHASWAERPGGLEVVVRGAAATATVRGGTLELEREAGRPERWVGAPPDAGEAVRAFAAALRTRRLPRDGLAAAVRVQETLEAAIRVG